MSSEQTAIEFLSYLRTLDVRLSVKDDKLNCTAPKGVMTPALAGELKQRKAELMVLLTQSSSLQLPPITRLGRTEYEPSAGQRQLWFLDRFDPDSSAYNIAFAARLTGTLDRVALEKAMRQVIDRHEVLRTAIVDVEGAPKAMLREGDWSLDYRSLEHLPEQEREEQSLQILKQEARRRFDLAAPPLVRACLIALGDNRHVLGIAVHHVAADGYSLGVFFQEMIAAYRAFSEGTPSRIAELPVQYSDYAIWRAQNFERKALEGEMRYWKDKLREPLPVTELPSDRPRSATSSTKGARAVQILPAELVEKVRRFSNGANTTIFVSLLTAYFLFLHRYTRQSDLIIGSASSGRGRPEIEGLIGLFIHNLVLRINLEGDPTVTELVGRVRETVLGAFANENVPLEELIKAVRPDRDMTRAPLFQTMFVYQNPVGSPPQLPNLANEMLIADTGESRYDLSLEAVEWESQVIVSWEYSTDLFDASTIERFQQHYRTLVENMIENPARAISTIRLLNAGERLQLLNAAVAGGEYPKDLCTHQWIEKQSALTPDAIAVECGDQTITYRELNRRSDRLAAHLAGLGVGPEVLVGVLLERSIDLVVALLAVLKSGGAYVPLDPSYPADRVAFILEDSKVAALITQGSLLAGAPVTQAVTVTIDGYFESQPLYAEPAVPPPSPARPENAAYVIYTSGSTGMPKGVQVLHRALTNFLASMQREPGMTASDRLLAVTTPSFDIAGLEFYLPLVSGGRVVVAPKAAVTDGSALAQLIDEKQITVMQATPVTWRMLLETGWQGVPGLKILCGGEQFGRELANRLVETGAEVWNLYGPTETTIWSSVYRVVAGEGAVPIGWPIANTRLYILDEHFEPVPSGAVGELFIAGDGLARGYLNRPDLTSTRFLDDPFHAGEKMYRSGDLARLLPSGSIECMGRVDGQIKLRGYRIELGEIEVVLERQDEVRQAVVIVREDTPGDQRLTAYVVARERGSGDGAALREALQKKLPDYMVPAAFVFLDELPLTPNRKVDRRALPAPDVTASRSARFVAPRTESEKQIAAIWQVLLKTADVGVTENFFDLGGHSLLVIQLQARLRKQLGWEPTLVELFQYPTVASIARLLDRHIAGQGAEVVSAASGD